MVNINELVAQAQAMQNKVKLAQAELAKQVKKMAEDCKVAVRNARRDAIEGIKKLLKDKQISEDISSNAEKDTDKVIADFIKSIDVMAAEKEKELLSF